MNPKPTRTCLLFRSTSHVMRAEKLLSGAGITARLVPVPRSLSSQCGVCLRMDNSVGAKARRVIEDGGVPVTGMHKV